MENIFSLFSREIFGIFQSSYSKKYLRMTVLQS